MREVQEEQANGFAKKVDAKVFHLNTLNYAEVEEALSTLVKA